MRTIVCAWRGGPLDIYRETCLVSHLANGLKVQLHSVEPFPQVPAGVEVNEATAGNLEWLLKSELQPCQPGGHNKSIAPGLEQITLTADTPDRLNAEKELAWIEAFKLWLPEYKRELNKRCKGWQSIPLHLSFASLAKLNLHCLPPEGSFLNEQMRCHQSHAPLAIRPCQSSDEVRQAIKSYFQCNLACSRAMLSQCCSDKALVDLGVMGWAMYAKRKAKYLLKPGLNQSL